MFLDINGVEIIRFEQLSLAILNQMLSREMAADQGSMSMPAADETAPHAMPHSMAGSAAE